MYPYEHFHRPIFHTGEWPANWALASYDDLSVFFREKVCFVPDQSLLGEIAPRPSEHTHTHTVSQGGHGKAIVIRDEEQGGHRLPRHPLV